MCALSTPGGAGLAPPAGPGLRPVALCLCAAFCRVGPLGAGDARGGAGCPGTPLELTGPCAGAFRTCHAPGHHRAVLWPPRAAPLPPGRREGGSAPRHHHSARPPGADTGDGPCTRCAAGASTRPVRQLLRTGRCGLVSDVSLLLPAGLFFPQACQCLVERFVMDCLFLALSPVLCPDPGVSGVCMHPEVACRLGNRWHRCDRECDGALLACSGRLSRRGLTHRSCCRFALYGFTPAAQTHSD